MEVAQLTLTRFAPFIKSLVYCAERSTDWTWEEFESNIKHAKNRNPEHGCGDSHLRHLWSQLHQLDIEQQQLLQSGELWGIFCDCLKTVTQVYRIELPDQRHGHEYCQCRRNVSEAERRTFNPLPRDTICHHGRTASDLVLEAKHGECICYKTRFAESITIAWPRILNAISTTGNSTITEITTTSWTWFRSGLLDIMAVDMTASQRLNALDVLPNLTSLTLTINLGRHFEERTLLLPTEGRDLAEVLRLAVNLKTLQFGCPYPPCRQRKGIDDTATIFHLLLHDCVFPKLRFLRLSNFSIPEQPSLGFLRNLPLLEEIHISGLFLTSGAWTNVNEYMCSWSGTKELDRCRDGNDSTVWMHVRGPRATASTTLEIIKPYWRPTPYRLGVY